MKTRMLMTACIAFLAAGYAFELYGIYRLNPDPCEDAYITFRYSRNLAAGNGPVFNAGEHVEGYSNPLWMAALAAAAAAGRDIVTASQVGGALCNTLALLLVWYIPWRHFRVRGMVAALAPLLYLLFLPLHFSAASGLETSLYCFLLLLGLELVLRARQRALPFLGASAVLLLVALTRPEGIVFSLFLGLYLLWRTITGRETAAAYLPGAVLLIVGYSAFLLWRMRYYGLPLPNTYYAKGAFPFVVRVALGVSINKAFLSHYAFLFILLLAGLGYVRHRAGRNLMIVLVFAGAGFFFSVGFSGFDWMPYFRYTLPVVPLLIILCQVMFARVWTSLQRPRQKIIWVGVLALVLFLAAEQYVTDLMFNLRWKQICAFAYHNQKAFGDWIRDELGPGPRIAIGDVGRLAYFSDARIIDIFGLASREFADLKKNDCRPDISYADFSVGFDSYKDKERALLLDFAPDYAILYRAQLKISETFPGSASGIADHPEFRACYAYLDTLYVIPRVSSPSWPMLRHYIDILDLSAGLLAWIRDGWGYDVYVRRDSPYPRFAFELYPDERIRRIRNFGSPDGAVAEVREGKDRIHGACTQSPQ